MKCKNRYVVNYVVTVSTIPVWSISCAVINLSCRETQEPNRLTRIVPNKIAAVIFLISMFLYARRILTSDFACSCLIYAPTPPVFQAKNRDRVMKRTRSTSSIKRASRRGEKPSPFLSSLFLRVPLRLRASVRGLLLPVRGLPLSLFLYFKAHPLNRRGTPAEYRLTVGLCRIAFVLFVAVLGVEKAVVFH